MMSAPDKILALANKYYGAAIIREARLLDNMAARILWSTIPYQEQINNIPALYSLLHGAKEYVKYGGRAIYNELQHIKPSNNAQIKILSNSLYDNFFKPDRYPSEFFRTAAKLFGTPVWSAMYGGPRWQKISEQFANLAVSLGKAEKTRGTDTFIENMNHVVMYMNVIDGMVHNTAGIIHKLVNEEYKEKGLGFNDQLKYEDKIKNLMDVKELEDKDDVIDYAKNIVKGVPEKYQPFKDWVSKRTRERAFEPQKERRLDINTELLLINLRKLNMVDIDYIKTAIVKLKDPSLDENEKYSYLNDARFSVGAIAKRLRVALETYKTDLIFKTSEYAEKLKQEFIYILENRVGDLANISFATKLSNELSVLVNNVLEI